MTTTAERTTTAGGTTGAAERENSTPAEPPAELVVLPAPESTPAHKSQGAKQGTAQPEPTPLVLPGVPTVLGAAEAATIAGSTVLQVSGPAGLVVTAALAGGTAAVAGARRIRKARAARRSAMLGTAGTARPGGLAGGRSGRGGLLRRARTALAGRRASSGKGGKTSGGPAGLARTIAGRRRAAAGLGPPLGSRGGVTTGVTGKKARTGRGSGNAHGTGLLAKTRKALSGRSRTGSGKTGTGAGAPGKVGRSARRAASLLTSAGKALATRPARRSGTAARPASGGALHRMGRTWAATAPVRDRMRRAAQAVRQAAPRARGMRSAAAAAWQALRPPRSGYRHPRGGWARAAANWGWAVAGAGLAWGWAGAWRLWDGFWRRRAHRQARTVRAVAEVVRDPARHAQPDTPPPLVPAAAPSRPLNPALTSGSALPLLAPYPAMPVPTGGGSAMRFLIADLAAEQHARAAGYTPETMAHFAQDLEQWPAAIAHLALSLSTFVKKGTDEWPIHPQVLEQLGAIYQALGQAAKAASEVPALFRRLHETDLQRHEQPRRGEHLWNVPR